MKQAFHPDQKLKCLLVFPKFAEQSFWNYRDACETIGAKTPSPPLGLITLAAILPGHWEFKLLDLNTREFSEEEWQWADLVCVSGMLPQQSGILEIISRAKKESKFVAVGGSDPSSQPDLYSDADALVVGEGESAVPVWLKSWREGQASGVFKETDKPDVTKSPIPRFDLLDFTKYVQIGLQFTRGCPFNCEFCDIIELFGRTPRTKTTQQFLSELDRLHELGYGGSIDIVDDNFVASKKLVKQELLPALINWNQEHKYPFFYCTEASLNLADDREFLSLMREAEFRVVFIGLETPDPDVLKKTQKAHNAMKPIVDRVNVFYEYGIVVTAGFIMGFDGEKRGTDRAIIKLINDCSINMAMVGLLVALPNTQLTRRLLKEGRLLSFQGDLIDNVDDMFRSATNKDAFLEIVDQTVGGLNYITDRDKIEILDEFKNVIQTIYQPKAYFHNVRNVVRKLKAKSKHRPNGFELLRSTKGIFYLSYRMTKSSSTRREYWKTFFFSIVKGHVVFEAAMRLMGIYLHFEKQSVHMARAIDSYKVTHKKLPSAPLSHS